MPRCILGLVAACAFLGACTSEQPSAPLLDRVGAGAATGAIVLATTIGYAVSARRWRRSPHSVRGVWATAVWVAAFVPAGVVLTWSGVVGAYAATEYARPHEALLPWEEMAVVGVAAAVLGAMVATYSSTVARLLTDLAGPMRLFGFIFSLLPLLTVWIDDSLAVVALAMTPASSLGLIVSVKLSVRSPEPRPG